LEAETALPDLQETLSFALFPVNLESELLEKALPLSASIDEGTGRCGEGVAKGVIKSVGLGQMRERSNNMSVSKSKVVEARRKADYRRVPDAVAAFRDLLDLAQPPAPS
jgi:hypothetical protein